MTFQHNRWIYALLMVLLSAATVEAEEETEADDWFPNFNLARISDITIDLPLDSTMSFYGQLSPVASAVNDGDELFGSVDDNNHSVSRFGAVIQRQGDLGLFQFQFETSLGFRTSKEPSQSGRGDPFRWSEADIRLIDFSLKFGNGQVLSIGQGKMATDGVTSLDLSRTSIANSVSIPDIGGGYRFRTNNGVLSPIRISDVFKTFDGVRRVRVRFDTRNRLNVWFSVSAGIEAFEKDSNQKDIDAAVHFELNKETFRLQAAAGQSISEERGENVRADTIGSASFLHKPTGLNATFATGSQVGKGGYAYLKLGIIRDFLPFGSTAFAIDVQRSQDIVRDNTSGNAFGFAVVQQIDVLDADVFLGYRQFSFTEREQIGFQDVKTAFLGARFRF